MGSHISERIPLSEKQDRRRKLLSEQKKEIVQLYATGLYSLNQLAKKFGVSKKLILITVNPKSAEKDRQRMKEHWRDYQQKGAEWAAVQREHRAYKRRLYENGELKERD